MPPWLSWSWLGLLCLVLYHLFGQVEIRPDQDTLLPLPADDSIFNFGPAKVRGASVFRQSSLSLAFVNAKPVVAGHVLVVPRRGVPQLQELSPEEVADLFGLVQKVDLFLQRFYGVDSTTISIQSEYQGIISTFPVSMNYC